MKVENRWQNFPAKWGMQVAGRIFKHALEIAVKKSKVIITDKKSKEKMHIKVNYV